MNRIVSCLLILLLLVGCNARNKDQLPTSIENYKVVLPEQEGAFFASEIMMTSEEEREYPFVAVVEGTALLSENGFLETPNIKFKTLGAEASIVSEFTLNDRLDVYEGDVSVRMKDTATYLTRATMNQVKLLTELPSIHIHAIKNLEGQNCEFIFLSRKNKITYPDGLCQVDVKYERNEGVDQEFILHVRIAAVNETTIEISVIPQ